MEAARAIEILERQRIAIEELRLPWFSDSDSSPEFMKWWRDTKIAVQRIFGEGGDHLKEFSTICYSHPMFELYDQEYYSDKEYLRGLDTAESLLSSMIDEIREYGLDSGADGSAKSLDTLERVCVRFHMVAQQLRVRHSDRQTLEIKDEYDVQDLLHALLKLNFDDVRPEEYTPSCSGGSARADFLLKDERIAIEVKKTRQGLGDNEIGKQLLEDIARYQEHPDFGQLVCFIYDPEGLIRNPAALVKGLENTPAKMPVRVIISPKGI